ncbi:MAG: SDR family NAD(P)-dependent oxidoreductase, partial [Pseudomonadota bacterium]|nr:SDR family NAD(P)-dependent oxidoreductase [Pseudomonadota bacterium]
MGRLEGKVAIVTGAARGIGASIATKLHQEGADVAVTDILEEEVHASAKAISKECLSFKHDVSRKEDWETICKQVKEKKNKIDILVNNAGRLLFQTLLKTEEEDFRKVHEVNVLGTFLGMQTIGKEMVSSKNGSIINICSSSGIEGSNGLLAYTGSKFAIRGMSKVAALELGPLGVRVNSVYPAGMNTIMGNPLSLPKEEVDLGFKQFPAQRIGNPEEVANAVVFL